MSGAPLVPVPRGEQILHEMLRDRGVDPRALASIRRSWDVFKEFVSQVRFDTPSDGVLYQAGVYGFHGKDEFYVDFVRQFEVTNPEGDFDHFEQLHCEFRFPVTDATRSYENFHSWWFLKDGVEAWTRFVGVVESRPEFGTLAYRAASTAVVKQERV